MNKLKEGTLSFIKLALIWLVVLLIIRLFEIVFNGITHEFPKELTSVVLWSWCSDLVFWHKWLFAEYVIFIGLFFIRPRLASFLYSFFIILIVIIQLSLIQYFNTSLVPLGSDLYGYSISDIKQTVGASGGVSVKVVLFFVLLIALLIAALRVFPKKITLPLWFSILIPALSLLFNITALYGLIRPSNYQSDFANNLVLNKTDYFFSSSYSYFFYEDDEPDIYADEYIGDYLGPASKSTAFTYLNESEYPFFHKNTDQDMLSPFFKTGKDKPNIVIILVEGLGRAFTNEGAYLGNFTPFIDSLAGKSLYWKNFLSQGGRTFAVLPSLMASLPFAKNGFLELGKNMPEHISLYSLLKFNGYNTSFYYGGDAAFDNMSLFLKRNQVDQINDQKSFPSGYTKLPAISGFTWGYGDRELFRRYLTDKQKMEDKTPKLDVILTVSMHSPFAINEQSKYIQRFEKRMDELSFENAKKDTYRNYKLQYSTIMYADDALKDFFNDYKKRADYENTIFLITGDHRMPEIPMSNKIDRYHVPLIIYSPLLKRTAQFASVSTHFDIAPSLLAYLAKNYNLVAPASNSWVGQGLDTTRSFQNIHSYPLIQTKTDIIDFIMGEYHLNGNSLYKMTANMEEELVQDERQYNQVKRAFDEFKKRNAKISAGGKIIPDSVYLKYNSTKK